VAELDRAFTFAATGLLLSALALASSLSAPARPPLSPSASPPCRPLRRAPPPRPWAVSKAGPAVWIPVSGQRSIRIKIIVSDTYPRRIRIRYAPDTGYAGSGMYPCRLGYECQEELWKRIINKYSTPAMIYHNTIGVSS
jgi:hypothetical protein